MYPDDAGVPGEIVEHNILLVKGTSEGETASGMAG
jgi:hypothetical protein